MFDFKRALNSALETHPEDTLSTLLTPWGEALDDDAVLQEYPRPQMRRDSYVNLNGWWDYAITPEGAGEDGAPVSYDGRILVPFSPEAELSGVKRQLKPGETLWYHRTVRCAIKAGNRLLLHFEAVDHTCTCYVNGRIAGAHRGAYTPFCLDVTEFLEHTGAEQDIDIVLAVKDPSECGVQPRGKQRLDRGSIWYTAQSGIWQTVWMEEVPGAYISKLDVHADADSGCLQVSAQLVGGSSADGTPLMVDVYDAGTLVASGSGEQASVTLDGPHLWSPDDPHLYELRIRWGADEVQSYCAFRSFTIEGDADDRPMFCCNHKPLFLKGVLDQGYWPDGLLTAPSDKALVYDIELAQKIGFNMMRKHIKVEQARWYYHCDRLGMIVWQDLVNGGGYYPALTTSQLPTVLPTYAKHVDDTKKWERFGSEDPMMRVLWLEEARATMQHLRFFPCIATWTVFNEGWGQFCAAEVTEALRAEDDTRPFDQTSGWFDQRGGDYISDHNYFRDLRVPKKRGTQDKRAPVISEFGGHAFHIPGHSCLERAYGYALFDNAQGYYDAVLQSLAEADVLQEQGLCGYVYTQLSDVEEEVNGLVSYDRRVVKLLLNGTQGNGGDDAL